MNILGLELSVNELTKIFTLYLCSTFIYIKLNNFKNIPVLKGISIIVSSLILSLLNNVISLLLGPAIAFLTTFLLYSFLVKLMFDRKDFKTVLSVTTISLSTGLLLLSISAAIVTTISLLIYNPDAYTNIYEQLATNILLMILTYFTFKIRRFKNWWYSLQNNRVAENIGVFSVTLSSIVICSYHMIKAADSYNDVSLFLYPTVTVLIIGLCLSVWIIKSEEIQYKINLRDRNNKSLLDDLSEQINENKKLKDTIGKYAKSNHELNHKIKVLNLIVADMTTMPAVTRKFKNKYGEDFTALVEEVKEVTDNLVLNKSKIKKLPTTEVFNIDRTLERMQLEAVKNNIDFEVKINGKFSINYMVEEMLSASKISTFLADHIKNAIIAINSSTSSYRSICVILGELNNDYGILIYDSGIEFEKEVLRNLGTEPITTHAESDGTGYGFVTTFETLREVRASLVIEEIVSRKDDYTKYVGMIFDNKNEFRIKSYREKELKSMGLENKKNK